MARYLGRQSAAHAAGLTAVETGDVEPYEAVPVQAVDPRQAWDEAGAVLTQFGRQGKTGKAPADWPQLVAAQPSHTGLAFAAGNFPQLVRDLAPLYRAESLAELPVGDGPTVSGTRVDAWAEAVAGTATNMKRMIPKARGSAGPIVKRNCHIKIVLSDS